MGDAGGGSSWREGEALFPLGGDNPAVPPLALPSRCHRHRTAGERGLNLRRLLGYPHPPLPSGAASAGIPVLLTGVQCPRSSVLSCPLHPIPSRPVPRKEMPADPSPAAAGVASRAGKLLFRSQIQPKFPSAAAAAGRNQPHLPGSRAREPLLAEMGLIRSLGGTGGPRAKHSQLMSALSHANQLSCVCLSPAPARGWRAQRTRFQGSLEDLKTSLIYGREGEGADTLR